MKTKTWFRAGQVAAQFNRTASWLRQLEARGIIPPAQRDKLNGARVYAPQDVERIREALLKRRQEASV